MLKLPAGPTREHFRFKPSFRLGVACHAADRNGRPMALQVSVYVASNSSDQDASLANVSSQPANRTRAR